MCPWGPRLPRVGSTAGRDQTPSVQFSAAVCVQFSPVANIAALALWFSLGGHYVELAFLNGLRARIPQGRLTQVGLRLVVWFTGGVVLYVLMAASARALPLEAPPLRMWWYGGLLLIVVELAVHGLMAMRGKPSFYSGRG